MARKLSYDKANKQTLMRENVVRIGGHCMWCSKAGKQLYRYWHEPDIGGQDKPDRFWLPFCSIDCYRAYHTEV